jgi:hypothetical protein
MTADVNRFAVASSAWLVTSTRMGAPTEAEARASMGGAPPELAERAASVIAMNLAAKLMVVARL